jgi:cellulose synthase/poly-beta-1,6-N-acetylglucosamine synthase-like glycosyltransferase
MAPLIVIFSAVLVLYVTLGYPLLLDLAARRRTRPIARRPELKPVSILLCVYNGEKWIRDKLKSILQLDYPREMMQILIVSDGSTDRTDEFVREFAPQGVELLTIPRSGKATAVNAGVGHARGEVLFFTDVRQPLDPACLKSLVSCLGDPQVGAACGHVYFIGDARGAHMGMYWRYEKWIRNNQTRLDSILAGTGCIYALRRELAAPIPADTLLDDSYLPLNAFLRGYRFVLDPEAIAYEYPTSLDTEFRRKVRTLAGIYQLVGFLPGLLGPSNRMWIHFVSYKFGRLLIPFALLLIAIASFWLPPPWATLALSVQALFYTLAIADRWIPEETRLKRLTSVIHTFVVLMLASLCAVSIFFVPPRSLWKETRVNS